MSSKVTEGQLSSKGLRFAIIVARFNSFVTERLLAGALDALARTGCAESDIEIVKVPGSWEMPVVARELAERKRHDALICLGAAVCFLASRGPSRTPNSASADLSCLPGVSAPDAAA